MRIAHITAPAPFGGLERVVAGLAAECAARGHDVMLVLVLDEGATIPAWAASLGTVRVEPVFLRPRAYLAERRAVRRLLRDHRAEVVHTHGFRADVVHIGVARRARLPVVSTAHGFASVDARGRLYEWLQVRAWRRFDAVVAVSEPLVGTLGRAGVPSTRLVMIRNGFSPSGAPVSRAEARARLGVPSEGTVVGWIGRFSAEKDPLLAIEAFARLADVSATLCMVGAGPELEAGQARAAALGVDDRVRFVGAVPDAGPLMTAFDVLLLSSRTEGTPMVVLEAGAAGVPVVGTAVGGVPDLLGDAKGWLAPAGDVAALAAALREALTGGAAIDRGTALRDAILARTSGEDWIDRYLGLYGRIARK